MSAIATYQREGSGWMLSEILHLDLNVELKNKKAIVNIKNYDNKCFMWSVLAALNPIPYSSKPERIHHYQPHVNKLNFDDVDFPVPISKIPNLSLSDST